MYKCDDHIIRTYDVRDGCWLPARQEVTVEAHHYQAAVIRLEMRRKGRGVYSGDIQDLFANISFFKEVHHVM